MYRNVEDILIKALLGEDFSNDFESVTKFYYDDLDPHRLSPQLTLLNVQLNDFKENFNFPISLLISEAFLQGNVRCTQRYLRKHRTSSQRIWYIF